MLSPKIKNYENKILVLDAQLLYKNLYVLHEINILNSNIYAEKKLEYESGIRI